MGIFGSFKDNVKDKAKDVSDAAEEEINEKTGGKYEDKVNSIQEQVEDKLGMDRDKPE
ncbi:antitoxin [Streptomyces sp. p1417]|uniref:Antitoxin n=1 Tax=Streptomyces typhae TaxID=2681492 RepID=A0A6L6WPS4_9ACTN|nr:antitoxin [Streptomyces typhae]MVO84040.1 antitoxin [Streptomyces typhae]